MAQKQELGNTPIFGMIHLAGEGFEEKIKRALEELDTFSQEGVDGAIIENYHGNHVCLEGVLKAIVNKNFGLEIGVNVLPNDYESAFYLANKYGAGFIQLDFVSGQYRQGDLHNPETYQKLRETNPGVFLMGGVHPKYYTPLPGSDLRSDIESGIKRADAIVVTGRGTGMETPFSKIKRFREIIDEIRPGFPLIIGAGLNLKNAYEQLSICNGAIVGTDLKQKGPYVNERTQNRLDLYRIKDFMNIVKEVRRNKQ